jgi:DUF438 domain-containing protein
MASCSFLLGYLGRMGRVPADIKELMAMSSKIEQLTELLKRLNSGEEPARVREEARDFLATVGPEELSFAEQQLVDAGLAPEDLRNLCAAHIEVLGDRVSRMKASLPAGHVIHTMIQEHERILGFLDELETLNQTVQQEECAVSADFERLEGIAAHLLGAEPHHQREEQVLFAELEKRGLFGPPRVMRMEHEELRGRKHALQELAGAGKEMEFKEFKKKLDAVAKFLVLTLRDHIFKENNILYPAALQVIPEAEVWQRMKLACDGIGYCCFTPPR